jgi:hypothetical protein
LSTAKKQNQPRDAPLPKFIILSAFRIRNYGDAGLDCAAETNNGIILAIGGNQNFDSTNERHAGF